jgi:hypothetical protein
MTKRPKDNTVGPWAKEKLEALAEYLNFYTRVLKNQTHWLRGTIFFDAFAGPGLSRVRSKESPSASPSLFKADAAAVEFLKGSPRVALEIANPFSSYIFAERDRRRAAELNALRREYGGRFFHCHQGGRCQYRAERVAWERHRLARTSSGRFSRSVWHASAVDYNCRAGVNESNRSSHQFSARHGDQSTADALGKN